MSDTPFFSCREVVDLVTDYLEGALAAGDRIAFERHVAICPPCRGHFAQLRRTIRTTGALREDELPPELRSALVEDFRTWKASGRLA